MPARLSLLWIFILFNMAFADVLSFMYTGFLKEVLAGYIAGIQFTPGYLVAAALLTEVPIAMIVLCRVLGLRANRWANIVAGVVTIAYVSGGSARSPHALFFSAVQVGCALLIVWYAWKWRSPSVSTVPAVGGEAGRASPPLVCGSEDAGRDSVVDRLDTESLEPLEVVLHGLDRRRGVPLPLGELARDPQRLRGTV
jgi:hypothetical protein